MNTMNKMQEEVTQNIELHHFILETFGLQSKKKRVRKKLFKQVVSQENLLKKVVNDFKQADQEVQEPAEQSTYIQLDHLPVTTLLKIGKEFFKEEESVRYYYNKNKEAYYKNKDVLVNCITNNFEATDSETQKAIIHIISK